MLSCKELPDYTVHGYCCAKVTGLQLVVSDQSGSRLKECPRMADPDQQMVTAPGSPHHPAADVTDPSPVTSCFSWCA